MQDGIRRSGSSAWRWRCEAAVALAVALAAPAGANGWRHDAPHGKRKPIEILSSAPEQVSGGDALVRVTPPPGVAADRLALLRNGKDVTASLSPVPGGRALEGVVGGLRLGDNRLELRLRSPASWWWMPARLWPHAIAVLYLRNHPASGPIFSGPQQQPFVCTTARVGLGPAARRQPGPFRDPGRAGGRQRQVPARRARLPDGGGRDRRLEQGLRGTAALRVPLPHDRRRLPAAREPERPAARGHRHDHDARRPHRALHRPLGARHHQPLRLQRRDAGAGRRDRPDRARRLALERAARLQPRGRRRDRPHQGTTSDGAMLRPRRAPARLCRGELDADCAPTRTTTSSSAARPR